MKNGKWNYSENIIYRVVLVKLHRVTEPPAHWQNAFEGQERQAVEITKADESYSFWIDNADGSGLSKVEAGGGPGSMSRHFIPAAFEIIKEIPEAEWQTWAPHICKATDAAVEEWQKTNVPEAWEKIQALKQAWAKSQMNRKNIKQDSNPK